MVLLLHPKQKASEDEIDEWSFHEMKSKTGILLLCPTRLELW